MITMSGEKVEFDFDSEEIIQSIAMLSDMRDFCLKQNEEMEGRSETAGALQIAIEVMQAFWCEKFGGKEND